MSSFWDRLRGRHDTTSADTARDRLKLVLVSDRSDISPEKLEQLQTEIIEVIKRYLDVDDAHVHIKLEQRARENYLVADIPLARDTSYGLLPLVDQPPEQEDDDAGSEAAPEPAPDPEEKPARATKPRKPRASSSGKSRSRKKKSTAADSDAEPESDTPAS